MKKLLHLIQARSGVLSVCLSLLAAILFAFSPLSLSAQSKSFTIEGSVTAQGSKQALVGANVLLEGTTTGTITDAAGKYKLTIPVSSKGEYNLVFSFLGYESKEFKFSGQITKMNMTLAEKSESVDNVVVTGYAPVRKEGFTGNTTRVTAEDLLKVSPKNVFSAIQVFEPSFRMDENVMMGSNPNELPEFYVRGRNSISEDFSATTDISRSNLNSNPNLPIFILDGFEVSSEKIFDMDVNRIHSITILKDAAATALYGSRASNGVMVIESRAPEAGKLRVSYNLTGSIETADLSDYNLMNAREKLQAEVDAGFYYLDVENPTSMQLNTNNTYYRKLRDINRGVETDWLAQGVRTVVNHQHSLYVDGGENDVRWGAEFKYGNQNGVMEGSERNNYGAGLFLDYRIGRFQIVNRISYDQMESQELAFSDFSDYSHLQPYAAVLDFETGEYLPSVLTGNRYVANPLYDNAYLNSYSLSDYKEIANNLAINFYANSDLTFKVTLGVDKKFTGFESFTDPMSYKYTQTFNMPFNNKGELNINNGDSFNYEATALAMYNKQLGKNYLNFSLGGNLREDVSEFTAARYTGFSSGKVNSVNDAAMIAGKPTTTQSQTRLAGAFLSGNYTYDNIYLADVSIRFDGSSMFGDNNKIAPFWAFGLGINIHNYDFMSEFDKISRLKVRASYGQTGKVNFSPYESITAYQNYNSEYWYSTGIGKVLYFMGNADLGWEKTNTLDAGIELGLLQDRIVVKASYYDKRTIDMITNVTLPTSSGFASYKDNLGEISNRGYEVSVFANVLRNKDWNVTAFGTLAHNKNKIIKVNDALKAYNKLVQAQYDDFGSHTTNMDYARTFTQYVEGGSTTSIFGMKSLGINPANGKELYQRADGTITYDWNAGEQVIIGDTEPDAQGSLGLNVSYKNFELFTSFLYEWGAQRYNSTLVEYVESVNLESSNADKRVALDRWKTAGDISPLKDIKDRTIVTRPTSRFVQDFNLLKFQSISLSYNFSESALEKMGIGMLRLTASMEDIAYMSSVQQERGMSYPYSKVVNFAAQVTF